MSRYVICYQGDCDPPRKEERQVVSSLNKHDATVIEQIPGSLLVDGIEADIAAALDRLEHWTFTPERSVRIRPPHKRIKQPA
ncbi:hypothetical protein [Bordetella genomosp. 13]|uniref:hypothetical protein n=1 Tax=Bordetella genomosp. 13 TaxID=463040 RepID=UPI0011A85770|nr:hypothetical protein [Bordetella genomosp. 13]